jgi:hypothetical protein
LGGFEENPCSIYAFFFSNLGSGNSGGGNSGIQSLFGDNFAQFGGNIIPRFPFFTFSISYCTFFFLLGKRTWIWLGIITAYAIYWVFFMPPVIFSGVYFAWFFEPYVGGYRNVTENVSLQIKQNKISNL